MFGKQARIHQLINDLLSDNYRSQQQNTRMLTDVEIEEAVREKYPQAKLKRIHVYRSYFNRRMHGFGLAEAVVTLRAASEIARLNGVQETTVVRDTHTSA